MFSTHPLIPLLIIPLLFSLGILIHPLKKESFIKTLLFSSSALTLLYSFSLWNNLNGSIIETYEWLPSLGISFSLKLDSLSLCMIIMTSLVCFLSFLGIKTHQKHNRIFATLFLLLQSALYGTFLAHDLFLFYFFWEMALLPMIFIVGVWGGDDRFKSTLKFFLYTLFGSLSMLMAIIFLVVQHKTQMGTLSSNYLDVQKIILASPYASWFFWGFTLAFLIKIPQFPFHNWQPDLYTQAPPAGAIFLSALMAKMGTYGLLRFSIGLFPEQAKIMAPILIALATFSIIYGAICAWSQTDFRRLIAYSSLSHSGFIVLGLFTLTPLGITGAIYQMFNHALLACAMFILAHALYERVNSYSSDDMRGLASKLPWLALTFFILTLSAISLPGTNNFAGEFVILLSSFSYHPFIAILAGTGVIFSALYSLKFYRKLMLGTYEAKFATTLFDLRPYEIIVMSILTIFIFGIGLFPSFFFAKMQVLP